MLFYNRRTDERHVDERHVGLVSSNMEVEDWKKSLKAVTDDLNVVELVTDASSSVKKLMGRFKCKTWLQMMNKLLIRIMNLFHMKCQNILVFFFFQNPSFFSFPSYLFLHLIWWQNSYLRHSTLLKPNGDPLGNLPWSLLETKHSL